MFMLVTILASSIALPALGKERINFDTTFRELILARIRAYGRGDVQAYSGMLADGFGHISDLGERRTAAQMRSYVGGHGDNHASYTISNLSWLLKGELAIVDAEVHEHLPDMELAQHETDIFVSRGTRWLFLLHQETARRKAPFPVAVAGDRLDDYAGRYQTTAGTIDVITVRDRKLFDQTLRAPSGSRSCKSLAERLASPAIRHSRYFCAMRPARLLNACGTYQAVKESFLYE